MVNVAVLVKPSIDTAELRVDLSSNEVKVNEAPLSVSSVDKRAMEVGVRIKEKLGGKVTLVMALTWGPIQMRKKEMQKITKELLAMGGDEAYVIMDEALFKADTLAVSKAIAKVLSLDKYDVVVAGEGSIDGFSSQVPPRVAEELGYPFVGYVTSVEVKESGVRLIRSMERYEEVVEVDFPLVISVTQEAAKPRIPSLMQILKASKLPVKEVKLEDLGIQVEPKVEVLSLKPYRMVRKNIVLEGDNPEELAEKLVEALVKEGVLEL